MPEYKIVSISMYLDNIKMLEQAVTKLKRRGFTKASKSHLIRYALSRLNVDELSLADLRATP